MKRPELRLISAFAFALLAWGQTYQGSLTGAVTDPSGASLPKAAVRVTNQLTNVSRSVDTDSQGRYTVVYLAPGSYSVEVTAAGFHPHLPRGAPGQLHEPAAPLSLGPARLGQI